MRTPTALSVAASTVLLALSLSACGQADDAASPGAPEPTTSTALSSDAPSSPYATAPTTDAEAAVRTWLSAARDGDVDALAADLGSYSQRSAEALGGLEGMASGLAEGMAAFSDVDHWAAVPIPGKADASLVVAWGQVTREGMTETAARSWIVHPENGRLVVETFAVPVPQVVAPRPGSPLPASAAVEVLVPAGEVFVVADGQDATAWATQTPADDGQLRVQVSPPSGWSDGHHTVAVAVTPSDGASQGAWASAATAFSVD